MIGGMGIVYPCFDHQEDRPIALKALRPGYLSDPEVRERFISECGIWIGLGHHPNVVTAYSVERARNRDELYLVLDLIVKESTRKDASLRAWLIPGVPMPLEMALSYGIQIARGMHYATSVVPGLVHRDLKPENILINIDGLREDSNYRAMVTDFGLAHVLHATLNYTNDKEVDGGDIDKSQGKYKILGTPLYMAPEQWTGEHLDINTDIYAFGCILFEMISGYPLVQGMTIAELRNAHCAKEFQKLPDTAPISLKEFVEQCVRLRGNYEGWNSIEVSLLNIYDQTFHKAFPIEHPKEKNSDLYTIGMSFNYLGFSMLELGEKDKALDYVERANRICQEANDEKLQTAVLNSLGMIEMEFGSLKKAADLLEQAFTLARRSSNRYNQAGVLNNLAQSYYELNNLQYAIQLYEQALQIEEEVGNLDLEAGTLINLGNCYEHLGNLDKALECHEKGLELARITTNWRWMANALGNIGICYRKKGDARRAIEYYQEANRIRKQYTPDKNSEAGTLINIGHAYLELGEPSKAIDSLVAGLKLSREIGNQMWEANALDNISLSYQLTGDLDQSIKYIQQALIIRERIWDPRGLCTGMAKLGHLYYLNGKPDEAIEQLEQSISLGQKTNYAFGLATACHILTVILYSLGRTTEALVHADTALNLYASMNHPNFENMQKLILEIRSTT